MHKVSLLSEKINGGLFVINEEKVNLGNSDNKVITFRKHSFSVIRLDVFGLHIVEPTTKLGKMKGLLPVKKRTGDKLVDADLFPDYLLINPSQWGDLKKKNKDGSIVTIPNTNGNTLVPINTYFSYKKDETISYQFNLKESNV